MPARNANAMLSNLAWLRPIGWASVAVALLLPLLAMQFEARLHWGFDWSASDFAIAAILLGGTGAALELAVRMSGDIAYRAGAFLAIGATLAMVWANLAVGLIGAEGGAANQGLFIVPAVGLLAATIGRFTARGMARAMLAMVAAQVVAGIAAGAGIEALAVTLAMASCWLAAAWLFHRAA